VKYPYTDTRVTGVLVPLAGLRSRHSMGCGEYADLVPLGQWCAGRGLQLIQLLPVNDSGSQSSPYSALSANALHPIYVRITDLPEYAQLSPEDRQTVDNEVDRARREYEAPARFDYTAVLETKLKLLRHIFDASGVMKTAGATFGSFTKKNIWAKTYALFRALKRRNGEAAWTDWPENRVVDGAALERLWKRADLKEETRFYLWVQIRLADQFADAADRLDGLGVALKGDLPILMNEDSADAWADGEIFRNELRAGAPPDMFSQLGQNWDFPVYDWEVLRRRDYDWWRLRLRSAERYYHAYRIDHVLGFFRIWAVPDGNFSGIPGFFWPQRGISREELYEAGFDDGRIRWLQEPHIQEGVLREALGPDGFRYVTAEQPVLRRLGDEDLFLFAPEVAGERYLADLDPSGDVLSPEEKGFLLEQYRDRALVELPDGRFAPTWTFRDCSRYVLLTEREKDRFESLTARAGADSNELWADHGRTVLKVLQESSDMLPCAEDLGVVPEAVPRVLESLGILGLKIPRWTYYWDRPGEPPVPFHEYPELSVCAPSVHDTSTMRGWWEKERGRDDLWHLVGKDGPAPEQFDPAVARAVYRAILGCPSRIVVFALQDLFALTPEIIHDDPDLERVNVPGSYNDFNWTWRMPLTLEDLQLNSTLNAEVSALTAIRSARQAGRTSELSELSEETP